MLIGRLIGSILLITGACVGIGVLYLPASMSHFSLPSSFYLLGFVWLFTCLSGLLISEVSLWLPENTNYVSMLKHTLGQSTAIFGGILSFILFYTLLASYTSVVGESIDYVAIHYFHLDFATWFAHALGIILFSLILIAGINFSEYINRILTLGLIITFALLLALIQPQIKPELLWHPSQNQSFLLSLPILATAFGYQYIVPSIRRYLHSEGKAITLAIILGTTVPLVLYALWIYITFGIIPTQGPNSLDTIATSPQPVETLIALLVSLTAIPGIQFIIRFFSFFAITTSLIPVALSLIDLLSDVLKIENNRIGRLIIVSLAFLPPYFLILFFPRIPSSILNYLGVIIAILYGILPAAMTWSGRYHHWQEGAQYKVWGGKLVTFLVFVIAVLIIISEIANHFFR